MSHLILALNYNLQSNLLSKKAEKLINNTLFLHHSSHISSLYYSTTDILILEYRLILFIYSCIFCSCPPRWYNSKIQMGAQRRITFQQSKRQHLWKYKMCIKPLVWGAGFPAPEDPESWSPSRSVGPREL